MAFPRPDRGENFYIVVTANREKVAVEALMDLLRRVGELLEAGAGQ